MTAVEKLEISLLGIISFDSEELRAKYKEAIKQAKEMEKEQIIDFANYCVELQYESFKTGEDINAETMEELLEIFKKEL